MRIKLQLFASLRERAGRDEVEVSELPDGLDVAALKRELEARFPEWGSLAAVRAVLGTEYVGEAARVRNGALVALLPPVSGGAPGEADELARGVFELQATPLDPHACQARVAHPGAGAVVVFTGTTRDENRGKPVERLEYEAFEAMSGAEMARIFARCRDEHGDPDGSHPERALRMLCQHRTGVVGVGQASVVIAVASPHREQAFAACRFLIDELKASLPVWKKEFHPDGEYWVGDRS